jgi:hypothetical protein
VLVSIVDPDIIDASSTMTPDADADTDADADVAPGEPSQKGEPCVCIGDGMPDSCTITIDVIVFKLALGTAILCDSAVDVLLACAIPPARVMLARGVCSASCAILGEDLHRVCHAGPAVPID